MFNLQHGYPDLVGKREIFCGDYTGPASYVQPGDPITTGKFQNYIDILFPAYTTDGLYQLIPISSGLGPRQTWVYKWIVISTGLQVANAVNLSGSSCRIGGYCGSY